MLAWTFTELLKFDSFSSFQASLSLNVVLYPYDCLFGKYRCTNLQNSNICFMSLQCFQHVDVWYVESEQVLEIYSIIFIWFVSYNIEEDMSKIISNFSTGSSTSFLGCWTTTEAHAKWQYSRISLMNYFYLLESNNEEKGLVLQLIWY